MENQLHWPNEFIVVPRHMDQLKALIYVFFLLVKKSLASVRGIGDTPAPIKDFLYEEE